MKIVNEVDTIKRIIKKRCSIARFGDGELKLALGREQMYQKPSLELSNNLKRILISDEKKLLIGIPRLNGINDKFWVRYQNRPFIRLYKPKKIYYSAFITRPDLKPEIGTEEYWNLMRQIWQNRNVVLVQGEVRQFEHPPNLLDNAIKVDIIYGPRKDAYDWRYTLIKNINCFPKDVIVILSLGPTATVLAYELYKQGYQALDLGHAGMFYSGIHPKSPNYTGAHYDTDKPGVSEPKLPAA